MEKILKKEFRVVIPLKEDENNEVIYVKNPNEVVITHIKEEIVKRINEGKQTKSNVELLSYLIKELTNVELLTDLDKLLEKDLSFEFKVLLHHVTNILEEINQEVFMMMKTKLERKKAEKLEREVAELMKEV